MWQKIGTMDSKEEAKAKTVFNPWLMLNLDITRQISTTIPSGWLEQDCWTDCD